jgi:hypothetical protein
MASLIPIYGGEIALVDEADFDAVSQYSWSLDSSGYAAAYAVRNGKPTTVKMHRLVCGEPRRVEVDHEDHRLLNNQRWNLRHASHRQNQGNRVAKKHGKSSKFKGVTWKTSHNRWVAQLRNAPKTVHLGYFKYETEAALAYDRAAVIYFGEFALTNF